MYYTRCMATIANDIADREALLDAWVEKRRQIAALEAEASVLLADRLRVHDADVREQPRHREAIHRSMIAEYSAAGRLSGGSVEYAFSDARFLDAEHPAVQEAFLRGAISAAHVREIIREGTVVRQAVHEGRAEASTLPVYDAAALVVAEQESPARTRALARQIASSLAGETIVERHRRARAERTVTMRPLDDGLALLQVVLPEHLAHAIFDRLTRLAQQVISTRSERGVSVAEGPRLMPEEHVIFGEGDTFTTDPSRAAESTPAAASPTAASTTVASTTVSSAAATSRALAATAVDERGIDQVRADLLSDLLLASDPSAVSGTGLDSIQARIQVTVAAGTLLGADDRPAELDGVGPLHPDIARDLAGRNGGWSRLFLDHAGMVTATAAYAPTAAMRRHLQARDQHCRFPGCRMPVHRCQTDHNHDHAKGGKTSIDNLSHFCMGHHSLKHPDIVEKHRWRARQLTGGDIEWTSPLGRTYTDATPRRVMFV